MRDLVECLPAILILWSAYASDETSINELSEMVSEVKPRVLDGLSEFFPCDFLTVPQVLHRLRDGPVYCVQRGESLRRR